MNALPDIIAREKHTDSPYNTRRAHNKLDDCGMIPVRIAVHIQGSYRGQWLPFASVTFDVRTHEGIEYLKQYVLSLQTELDRLKIDSPSSSQ